MDISNASTLFAALSQDTRLEVLQLLIKAGERGRLPGEISAALDVRQNTLSANLSVLLHADLVTRERQGRTIRYFANLTTVRKLMGFLMQDCCGGRPETCQPIFDAITVAE